ncbi:MAG: hypothetical protein R2824_02110 [Saprospiraceae bacterium]|nr:hypothetical protein [Lewinella sp.]
MRSYFYILLLLPFFACRPQAPVERLLGAWKVDSTYTYYNGFSYTQREEGSDWATYVYEPDGIMKEIKYGSFQSYFFDWQGKDTIALRSTQGGDKLYFQVLSLDPQTLVLKRSRSPIFSGNNQERYEIRFLSRTDVPEADLVPFSDPRH